MVTSLIEYFYFLRIDFVRIMKEKFEKVEKRKIDSKPIMFKR